MIWFFWATGSALAMIWLVSVVQAGIHSAAIADITRSEWNPAKGTVFPSLTVVVAARNEEADIEPALRSLLDLNLDEFDVIAVNDRSTDQTGRIIERIAAEDKTAEDKFEYKKGKLRCLHICNLPPGWLGKTHAMWVASQEAHGDWLLFTDADCVFHSDALRRALYYAIQRSVDHLVLFPTPSLRTWGERMMLSFPPVIASLGRGHRPWKVRDPKAKDCVGVGAFNLIRRQAYTEIGGHEPLRMEVADDLKLGEMVKRAGLRQDVVVGPKLVCLRWAVGASGVIRNLEKNLFAFLRFSLARVALFSVALFFFCIWPFLGMALAPGWTKIGFGLSIAMIAIAYYQGSRYVQISGAFFLSCPVSALLYILAALRSMFVALRNGKVTWRGTGYSLEELRKGS